MSADEVRHYPGLKATDPEIVTTLKKIRYDLTDLQGKVSEALRMAAQLNLATPVSYDCPDCGLKLRSALKLAEHAYVSHGGALPDAWAKAEAMADESEAA